MTPPRDGLGPSVHPQDGPIVTVYRSADCPAWTDDYRLAPLLCRVQDSVDFYRATQKAEGRAVDGEGPAAKATPKRRKKDPLPNQSAMFATKDEGTIDGRYDRKENKKKGRK